MHLLITTSDQTDATVLGVYTDRVLNSILSKHRLNKTIIIIIIIIIKSKFEQIKSHHDDINGGKSQTDPNEIKTICYEIDNVPQIRHVFF